jgi:hypothetical protein
MGIRQNESLVNSEFVTDEDGNPTGGRTEMMVAFYPEDGAEGSLIHAIDINWQDGIIGDNGQNGAFVEDVLEAVRQRIMFFNSTKFRCRENSLAITKIEEALQWLDWRTRQRLLQDVENTYETHTDGGAGTA